MNLDALKAKSNDKISKLNGKTYTFNFLKVRLQFRSGYMTLHRECATAEQCLNTCEHDDQENCRRCCSDSNNCNDDDLVTFGHANGLTHTCYACQYSDIPGVRKDEGCQLAAFDKDSSEIFSVECPGMCFVSSLDRHTS